MNEEFERQLNDLVAFELAVIHASHCDSHKLQVELETQALSRVNVKATKQSS